MSGCGREAGVRTWLTVSARYLALIGFSKEPRFTVEKSLIDYNVQVFQDALTAVLALT